MKKEGSTEPEKPEVDPKVLNVKVVDESGSPVANVPMYLKTDAYGGSPNLDLGETDSQGELSYTFSDQDMVVASDEGNYELLPTEDSGYVCDVPKTIELEFDDELVPYISTVEMKTTLARLLWK